MAGKKLKISQDKRTLEIQEKSTEQCSKLEMSFHEMLVG